ncbi:MAG TPA: hypothetical protein VKU01_23225 [Bryobacteraceae bacterium]|nr:hypothetical protein [Bryobacteraceae bacterium]
MNRLRSPFLWPLIALAPPIAIIAGIGLAAQLPWRIAPLAGILVSVALHACWLLACVHRRGWVLAVVSFILSLRSFSVGLPITCPSLACTGAGLIGESLLALLALAPERSENWAARLARWRRARAAVTAEILLADGLAPWARAAFTHLLHGQTGDRQPLDRALLAAEISDAESTAATFSKYYGSPKSH